MSSEKLEEKRDVKKDVSDVREKKDVSDVCDHPLVKGGIHKVSRCHKYLPKRFTVISISITNSSGMNNSLYLNFINFVYKIVIRKKNCISKCLK